jgi:hypothetical protein
MLHRMNAWKLARGVVIALLLVAPPACDGDDGTSIDPTCCERVYPEWCERFAECDPVTFALSWRDADACTTEQVTACRAGRDSEALCAGRSASQTDACITALDAAVCDDLFGSAGLPDACTR